ncbi:aldo/keto reductase [Paractinoplanes atraurantiacus]|uniref:Predicted oxidoreductase n=1 Tax=Paractinoplanes atraurantiacus TaxID=1036182 RepID=A0A285IAC6_9ACTN|nr:aldo/keto reductase [Actinoplanes atraurantiacus]SNY44925.1 Predicted oxidoreductase [Actinoplanes atraurantiacus]
MNYRTLGASGLRVSELILGTMTFEAADGECARILDTYAEAGGNTIDTAVNYRDGASEEILGKLLAGRRERFVLGSKYTVSRDRRDPNAGGNARKNLRASLETSLQRLGTDYLDLYWVHMWDRATPIEETMRALDDAVRAGKILYVGISDAPAWVVARANTLAEWRGWSAFVGLQVPYSLLQRDVERELLPMAAELGLGVTAWSPLAGGVLTGKYSGGARPEQSRFDPAGLGERAHTVARAVHEVAAARGVPAAQVAIAWTRARHADVFPIVGARKADQLQDNLGAVRIQLSTEELARLEAPTGFEAGFPQDFIDQTSDWVLGAARV